MKKNTKIIKKIDQIKKISVKLSNEYPGIKLLIKFLMQSEIKIEIEIFFNISKTNKKVNKFMMLDGGIKDRIIRKTKNLLKSDGIKASNIGNIFIII
jgi:hypothetical protein